MTYPGARESRYYFHQLECCRRSTVPHHITSVIGGMAFLHAIGTRTKSLRLVDVDPDAINLCCSVIEAINRFHKLSEFRQWVNGNAAGITTHLEGHGLEPDHFYWHFGEHSFASQDHYEELRIAMPFTNMSIECLSLSEVTYSNDLPIFVFASNADGALGFDADKILPRVISTTRSHTTYVSWLHRIVIEPNPYKRNYNDHRDL